MTDYDDWRHSDGVYVLCRKCGYRCGRVYGGRVYAGVGVGADPCPRHGPLKQPSDRELDEAVAKERATGRPVPLRAWPAA